MATLLQSRRQLQLRIESAGQAASLRTPTLFVGNNRLQLTRAGIDEQHAESVAQGQLAAVAVRPIGTLALFGLLLRGLLGRLGDAENIRSFSFKRLTVTPKGMKRIKVATDGEIAWMQTPLVFEVAAEPLLLLVPGPPIRSRLNKPRMACLLQISDPHFGTVQPAVMQALVALAKEQRPDVLVLSGDITQRARVSQFTEARAFCDRLAIPRMLAIAGNHDIPLLNLYQRLFTPYARFLQAFGPVLEPVVSTPLLHVIGVKTTRRWRHKNGEVSAAQIERVVAELGRSAPAQLRIVVVHQPVHVLHAEDQHDRLRGWEPAVHAWAGAGADIVMGGHIHLPYVCDLSTPPERAGAPALVRAGGHGAFDAGAPGHSQFGQSAALRRRRPAACVPAGALGFSGRQRAI